MLAGVVMKEALLEAIEGSDSKGALKRLASMTKKGEKAWDIHLALFPVAQRVLNPPFINPHLPKMYGVFRDLIPYLEEKQIEPLVRLEVNEYARRPKVERFTNGKVIAEPVSFADVEAAIGANDPEKTTAFLSAYCRTEGRRELARRLLLLGSGYLEQSIGHSVSCTAFILLEMLERVEEDPLPTLWALAHYFCQGRFQKMPRLRVPAVAASEHALRQTALKATSGRGFVNLHHTIILYAVERVGHLFTPEERGHLRAACDAFIGIKDVKEVALSKERSVFLTDYPQFYQIFSRREAVPVVALLFGLTGSADGTHRLGQFLVRGVCDVYNGNYDPHFLTGLGAALWAVNRFAAGPGIAANALYQYADYFFGTEHHQR